MSYVSQTHMSMCMRLMYESYNKISFRCCSECSMTMLKRIPFACVRLYTWSVNLVST